MKKTVVFAIMVLVLFSFAACKQERGTGVVTPSQPAVSDNGGTQGAQDTSTIPPDVSGTSGGTGTAVDNTKIDLTVVDVYFTPTYSNPNEDVVLKFIFKNQGVEDAPKFEYSIKILKDGSVWKEEKFTTTSGLARGEDSKLTNNYIFPTKGTYSAEVYVDPDNKIGEVIETNNYKKAKADAVVYA